MDKEERNYCCLVLLLSRVGLVKLRKLFIEEWNSMYSGVFVPWTDSHQNGTDLLTKYTPHPPYERPKVQSGDTTKWDISLFVKVLLNSRPPFVDMSNRALVEGLKCLRETRNSLCHTESNRITPAEFTPLYKDLFDALLVIGASTMEFKNVEDDAQNLEWNELLYQVKQTSAQDKDMLQGIDTINNRLGDLHEAQRSLFQDEAGLQEGLSAIKQDPELYSINLKEAITRQTDLLTKQIYQSTLKTDDIFTSLTIHHGKKELLHQGISQDYEESQEKEEQEARKTLSKIKQHREIFVDESKESNPKSILVSGKPGIGKTLFSQKIVRDWSSQSLLIPDIKFFYLITFSELARLGNKQLTLREMLNVSPLLDTKTMLNEEIMEYIIQHPEQLFTVFDGFDEYKDRDKIIGDFEEEFPNDVKAKMPVAALVSKLIRKKILRDSVSMITSRPSESSALDQKMHFDRYVEITGFSESQVIEYVEKYFKCKPEKVRKMAVNKVKGSPHHISFGRAPFRCFLMCILIEWEVKNKRDNSVPAKLTEFYHNAIKCIERNYNKAILSLDEKTASLAVDQTLDNFAQLAAHLVQQNRFSFTSEELGHLNSTEKELLLSSNLIFCYTVSSNSPFQKPTCEYSFTHFTIQEFFVALYLVKTGVMAAQESTEMVYIFMSGLLGLDHNEELMLELLECLGKHMQNTKRNDFRLRLVSLRCLFEYGHDKSLTRQELTANRDYRYWDILWGIGLYHVTDSDCGAIAMLVESSATSMSSPHRLLIQYSPITSVGLKSLLQSLIKPNCTISELCLIDCDLDDDCTECLSRYLPNTKVTVLYLSGNDISDVGLNHIVNRLPSNLTALHLDANRISHQCRRSVEQFCNDNYPGFLLIID